MVTAVVVDLGGGDVAVTQQILDLAVVRADVESRVAERPYYSAERLRGYPVEPQRPQLSEDLVVAPELNSARRLPSSLSSLSRSTK